MSNEIFYMLLSVIAVVIVILILIAIVRRQRKKPASSVSNGSNNQIYVGNLAYRVTERDLRYCFNTFGEIISIKVVKDRNTQRSKGYGFVTFTTHDEAEAALAAHGKPLRGRPIVVRIAKART